MSENKKPCESAELLKRELTQLYEVECVKVAKAIQVIYEVCQTDISKTAYPILLDVLNALVIEELKTKSTDILSRYLETS